MIGIRRFPTLKAALVAVMAALALAAGPAAAQGLSLDEAKKEGLVGERPDGLVGIVRSTTPELRRLVEEINARRLEEYARIARRNGTTLAAVQAIVGAKLIRQARFGTYIMGADGQWMVKLGSSQR